MIPVDFEKANLTVGKPTDWKEGDCGPVRAWHGLMPLPSGEASHAFTMHYMPSREEEHDMAGGSGLYLTFFCDRLVPHSITTHCPIPDEPIEKPFPENWGLPKEFVDYVVQNVGAASMCWSEQPTGIYDSKAATEIALNMLEKFGAIIQQKKN